MDNRANCVRTEQLAKAEQEAWGLTNNVKLALQKGDIVSAKKFAELAIQKLNEISLFRTILSKDVFFPDTLIASEQACIQKLPEVNRTIPMSLPARPYSDPFMPRGIVARPGPLNRAPVMQAWMTTTDINHLRRGASVYDMGPLVIKGRFELPTRHVRVRLHERSRWNVHTRNNGSLTDLNVLLCQAAELSDSQLVRLLLEKGADITSTDSSGKTALHIACKKNSLDIIKLLAEYSPAYILDMPDADGRTPLDIASRCNSPDVVQYLLLQGSSVDVEGSRKCDPLFAAALNRKYAKQIVSLLLNAGANIDRTNYISDTLLITTVTKAAKEMQHGTELSTSEFYQSYADLFTMLIERGCDVNAANPSGDTALHIAVRTQQANLVQKLLLSGSDISKHNSLGCTPLIYACRMGNRRIIDMLISCGAHLKRFSLGLENDYWFHYAVDKAKECNTLENLCFITIRKNIRNVEQDVIQLGLPPWMVKRIQLEE